MLGSFMMLYVIYSADQYEARSKACMNAVDLLAQPANRCLLPDARQQFPTYFCRKHANQYHWRQDPRLQTSDPGCSCGNSSSAVAQASRMKNILCEPILSTKLTLKDDTADKYGRQDINFCGIGK